VKKGEKGYVVNQGGGKFKLVPLEDVKSIELRPSESPPDVMREKLASLRRDREVVGQARQAAIELVDDDPLLAAHPELAAELELFMEPADAEFLLKG